MVRGCGGFPHPCASLPSFFTLQNKKGDGGKDGGALGTRYRKAKAWLQLLLASVPLVVSLPASALGLCVITQNLVLRHKRGPAGLAIAHGRRVRRALAEKSTSPALPAEGPHSPRMALLLLFCKMMLSPLDVATRGWHCHELHFTVKA